MINFFVNTVMYLIVLLMLIGFFKNKMNIMSFLIILFNMNVYFIFILKNISFFYGLITFLVSVILYHFYYLFNTSKSEYILIKDGNINFHEVISYYSFKKLINYLKIRHIRLDEIAYCIKRDNHLIVIKNELIKSLPVSIIVDGNVMSENLKLINKNSTWLKEELLNNHILVQNVDFAYYKNNKIYFIKN